MLRRDALAVITDNKLCTGAGLNPLYLNFGTCWCMLHSVVQQVGANAFNFSLAALYQHVFVDVCVV